MSKLLYLEHEVPSILGQFGSLHVTFCKLNHLNDPGWTIWLKIHHFVLQSVLFICGTAYIYLNS